MICTNTPKSSSHGTNKALAVMIIFRRSLRRVSWGWHCNKVIFEIDENTSLRLEGSTNKVDEAEQHQRGLLEAEMEVRYLTLP